MQQVHKKIDANICLDIAQQLQFPTINNIQYLLNYLFLQSGFQNKLNLFSQQLEIIYTLQASSLVYHEDKIFLDEEKLKTDIILLKMLREDVKRYDKLYIFFKALTSLDKQLYPDDIPRHKSNETKLNNSSHPKILVEINQGVCALNKNELMHYFDVIKKFINKDKVGLYLSSNNYQASLFFDQAHNKWNFFAMHYIMNNELGHYYQQLNTQELANTLFQLFSEKSNYLVFSHRFISLDANHKLASTLESFNKAYYINSLSINRTNHHQVSLIHEAIKAGFLTTVKELLAFNTELVNKQNDNDVTIFHFAAYYNQLSIIQFLVENYKININIVTKNAINIAYIAAQKDYDSILLYLQAQPNNPINNANSNGDTALHVAAFRRCLKSIKVLLAYPRIKINKQNKSGQTALHLAIRNDHEDAVKLLLTHDNIDPNRIDNHGLAPLHYAISNANLKVVQLLSVHKKIDLNTRLSPCPSPLYIASQEDHGYIVSYLLQQPSIDPNKPNKNGVTPLYIATQNENIDSVKLLCQHKKIKISKPHPNGHTPLDIAKEGRHQLIEAILIRYLNIKNNPLYTDIKTNVTPAIHEPSLLKKRKRNKTTYPVNKKIKLLSYNR